MFTQVVGFAEKRSWTTDTDQRYKPGNFVRSTVIDRHSSTSISLLELGVDTQLLDLKVCVVVPSLPGPRSGPVHGMVRIQQGSAVHLPPAGLHR